jgi:hypothetical protein
MATDADRFLGRRGTALLIAGRTGARLFELVQRGVDLLQEALDFLALVRANIFLQTFQQLLFPCEELCDRCHRILAPEPALHLLSAGADLLDRLLHGGARRAALLRLVADFITLPARDAGPVLVAPAGRLFLCHCFTSPLISEKRGTREWVP